MVVSGRYRDEELCDLLLGYAEGDLSREVAAAGNVQMKSLSVRPICPCAPAGYVRDVCVQTSTREQVLVDLRWSAPGLYFYLHAAPAIRFTGPRPTHNNGSDRGCSSKAVVADETQHPLGCCMNLCAD